MVFQADTAFALELIALGIGFWILIKARGDEAGNLKGFGSFIGYFIIVAAFLALLCTGYYSMKYWEDGYFNKPYPGKMMMMRGSHMMEEMGMHSDQCGKMMKSGMMKSKMRSMMGDKSGMQDNEDHMEYHPGMKDKNENK
ncbi:MAG: hypothetical protein GWO85_00100 [Simkaniaceae bacterium]|nr:hypothetical protein [Simkaniaceae bacterium]